jgi:hypothetical protein
VAVVAVAGDHLVAVLERHLHADDDGFLADIEVAEPADEAHAVKLAGLFLEAADQSIRSRISRRSARSFQPASCAFEMLPAFGQRCKPFGQFGPTDFKRLGRIEPVGAGP